MLNIIQLLSETHVSDWNSYVYPVGPKALRMLVLQQLPCRGRVFRHSVRRAEIFLYLVHQSMIVHV